MRYKKFKRYLKRAVLDLVSSIVRGRFVRKKKLVASSLLNVGCGKNALPTFLNLDYTLWPGVNVCWDLRKSLPFPSASFDGIFTEHCLEHINYFECLGALAEFLRILKPGGVIRIVVPDGGLYLALYARSKAGEVVQFPYVGEAGKNDLLEDSHVCFTPMMAVNRIFRSYGHRFAYDYETMAAMLNYVGFQTVSQSSFGIGVNKRLIMDSDYRKSQSLYIEAIKGG